LYRVLEVSMEEVPEKVKLMMVYYHCTNDVECGGFIAPPIFSRP
jgi:nitrogenase subunit NifH